MGRNKVNSFQWFHIPTLLNSLIQSQPPQQSNQLLSQLLQRMMTILDECFDCQTPILNKRLLHSSLTKLTQSPSLDPRIKRGAVQCIASLEIVEESDFVVVKKDHLDSMEATQSSFSDLQQKLDQLQARFGETERKNTELEKEKGDWLEEKKTLLSTVQSLQREKEQMRIDHDRKVEELNHIVQQMRNEAVRKDNFFVSPSIIVAFHPNLYRVNGSTVTRINSDYRAGCFTKPVTKGIYRLSIRTEASDVMIGVIDAAEYPQYLTTGVYSSPKAAITNTSNGHIFSAKKSLSQNTPPQRGQEISAEADLEKRTLHFFVDGVQQPNHFINLPVPLVFAVDLFYKDVPIEITFWGEETQSHVTFQGTGHNLG
ncbi:hypothetical protein BLNAU_19993 [Blattamonas nauphoetae]|uniref:SPRY domain-containing protein n=1 Tax=Blattamonas nauphoetae TaxID=2049346 RepID=A0ABQ9X014_9EUKA|nr:hypothetical protein BLNAU_19993 [Blattamonas nauphoetae]